MKSSARTTLGLLALAALATLPITGCGSSPEDTSHDAITGDLTPELMTLDKRPVDYGDDMSVTFNSNWRAMWGDVQRALLIDRPSRLAPYPIAH